MVNKDVFMLCHSIDKSETEGLDASIWKAQTKFDGERILGIKNGEQILLMNRRGNECSRFFPEVVEDVKRLTSSMAIVDGEVISLDDDFNKLQRRAHTKDTIKAKKLQEEIPVKYVVFDILREGNEVLVDKPLLERMQRLSQIIPADSKLEQAKTGEISDMLRTAKSENREGIVIKNIQSHYESRRSRNWLKLKFTEEKDVTMVRYVPNPKGIRVENSDGSVAIQISGEMGEEARHIMDQDGEVTVTVSYLEETPKALRQPVFKKIVGGKDGI